MKINGSLVFDASSASEIKNLRVEKFSTALFPVHGSDASNVGRFIYNSETGVLYVGGASAWVALATGGNAAALQDEVNAIETSLGAIVAGADGTFVTGQVTGPAIDAWTASHAATAPQDLTELLQAISDYATAGDTLAELNDVTLTLPSTGQFLQKSAGNWVNHTLVTADVSDLTASAAELNILDGATLTVTELNFVDGVTSAIQTQLDNKQALDAGLTSFAALTGPGFVTVDALGNVVSSRSLVAPAAGVTISFTDGSGNPVFALANDLAALEGLATNGYVVRTGDGSATTRALSTVVGDLVITGAADGVSTDTTFGLATVAQADTGTFVKVTLDTKGRVTGNTAVTTGDITALVSGTYVDVLGDTMTGSLIMSADTTVTVPTPTAGFTANNAVNKSYVDSLVTGISWKEPVDATGAVNPTTFASGYRFLNTTDGKIYTATAINTFDAGVAPAANWSVLDKTTDAGYTYDADTLTWVQFSGAGQINAGVGLAKNGNTLDVLLGAGIAQLPTDEVGVDIAAGKAVQLTSTATGGQVTFVLDGAGLEQSALGLKISAAGVTNAMLLNSQLTINGDAGTDALALGDTLQIKGTVAQGISTSVAESPAGTSTFTITVADTTTTTKGVAQFADADFAVAAGVVSVKAAGIDNVQLVNSTVTLTGTTGSDAFALGESVAIVGGATGEVSTDVTANSVAISVRDATTSLKGVASFSATDFSVTAGAVTAVAKGLDALTDVAITTAAAGQTLVYSTAAGGFVNRKVFHTEAIAVAASTWIITHGLGQKFCNVTVADATDEVVIPQSIKFDSATQLTVTFNTAIAGSVMVSGVSGA